MLLGLHPQERLVLSPSPLCVFSYVCVKQAFIYSEHNLENGGTGENLRTLSSHIAVLLAF